ncbi:hypothetical protein CFM90_16160 [Ralstonia solanacearum]|nr:hypothetical protein CFM90_16160 [Ralstonia solanacearum]
MAEVRPPQVGFAGGIYRDQRAAATDALAVAVGAAVIFIKLKDIAWSTGFALSRPRHQAACFRRAFLRQMGLHINSPGCTKPVRTFVVRHHALPKRCRSHSNIESD